MYLSHMGEENIVMTVKDFKRFWKRKNLKRATTSMSLPSHRPLPPLENKIANRKGFLPFLFLLRLQCFTPILVILLPSLPLAPSGFAVPYKNHPLLFFSSYGKLSFVLLPFPAFSRPSLRFETKGLLCPYSRKNFPFFR